MLICHLLHCVDLSEKLVVFWEDIGLDSKRIYTYMNISFILKPQPGVLFMETR